MLMDEMEKRTPRSQSMADRLKELILLADKSQRMSVEQIAEISVEGSQIIGELRDDIVDEIFQE